MSEMDSACVDEVQSLVPVCSVCGAECHYLKQDRVSFGATVFVERMLTCCGCGLQFGVPSYFPVIQEPCTL